MPRLAVFLVDESELVAETFDDVFHRLDIGNLRLKFDLLFESTLIAEFFFIGESGALLGLSQTQDGRSQIEQTTAMKIILLKRFVCEVRTQLAQLCRQLDKLFLVQD